MAFRNQPIAGTYLVRSAMQSPNFVSGSSGWSVNRDGSAEFNNVTIRGSTIDQGVSLFYSGTPAAGNMIVSIAPAAGTDAYGNAYPQGIATYDGAGHKTGSWNLGNLQTYDPVSTGSIGLFPQGTVGLSPMIQIATGGSSSSTPTQLSAFAVTTGTGQPFDVATFYGPASTADTHQSYAAVQLRAGGTVADGAIGTLGWGNSVYSAIPFQWNQAGIAAVGIVYAGLPGTGTGTVKLAAEVWHTTPLSATWSQLAATPCSYRLMPDGTVLLKGTIQTSNTALATNAVIVNALPTGYRPLATSWHPVTMGGPLTGQISISTAGVITLFFTGGPLNQPTVVLDNIRFPVI